MEECKMYEDRDDRDFLENQQQQLELLNKLKNQSIKMKAEIVNAMYFEIEKRVDVYKDFGLTPSGMFYTEMKRMFTGVFAGALMEVFGEDV